jgi:hypothetical protein
MELSPSRAPASPWALRVTAVAVAATAVMALSACSNGAGTGGVAVADPAATRACADVASLVQARAAGALRVADLRARLGAIYQAAQASGNTVLRARAVALYTDGTLAAIGGGNAIDADLHAIDQMCQNLTS